MANNPLPGVEIYLDALSGRKAKDIVVLDVRGLTSIADFFILCSGSSNRQVSAIAEYTEEKLKHGSRITPLSVEGKEDGSWALLDYGDAIIHIFFEEVRSFYDLEGLWSDAKKVEIENRNDSF